MNSIEISAHAKVNLFLKVLGKRRDSYHNILTLFEKISLADKIKISKMPKGITISSDKFITRSPKNNLAYKAAALILKEVKIKSGVKIEINKNIPIAGGLGGGSSDAASVLTGINTLFDLRIKKDGLARLAGRLGADVPFFLLDAPFAIGSSKGDKLKAINSKAGLWHLLIWPGFGVATKGVYEAFDASAPLLSNPSTGSGFDPEFIEGSKGLTPRLRSGSSTEPLSKYLTKGPADVKIRSLFKGPMDFGTLESMLHNDLQDIAISKKKVIGRIINRLASSIGKKAIVSGSGPSLFCLYRTRKEAVRARDMLLRAAPARGRKLWRIFIVKTSG